ncbi:hypothetical protein DICSQDRAFT_62216 [Dichomitus squalens LYAD-421 SS1]|uniref:ATP phosphoribosyltransferase n=1 Tax=Dichomitus squalens (strain LYAD-421) TaxID=732165 RepID=R7SX53_DICSQ|nr:uncharacterized protein DICSQDRAFT_62216 [Dichomitus squalens LYAD-421 SS1]EJF60739.1 hypothetical protein DICSQDRAFT_62216 [Dichomitus squalens LYAD-421 SS1]
MSLKFKLVFFVPRASTQTVLQHLFSRFPNEVGRIGAYGGCAFVSPGTGQFVPLEGANPVIGEVGKPERVEEDRVEVLVLGSRPGAQETEPSGTETGASGVDVRAVLQELKKVHPYEEVAYDVYRLEDF